MDNIQFDLVSEELNPTFLFAVTIYRTESENHYHTHDFPEIGVILEGEGTYHMNDQYVSVREGDILIFNPGVGHESVIQPGEAPRKEYFVGFTDVHFTGMRKNHIEFPDDLSILHMEGKAKRALFRICEEMEKESIVRRPGRYFMLKSYLVQFLLQLVREKMEPVALVEGRQFGYGKKRDTAEQIADYLEEHYADRISLDQIAENMYLSPFYISKIFKAEIGESPIHYLIRIRMEKAALLLQSERELPVSEVAQRVGYDDVYHFSKLFKKTYGVSPSQMRKDESVTLDTEDGS